MACASAEGAEARQVVGAPVAGTAQPAEAGAGQAPLAELGSAQTVRVMGSTAGPSSRAGAHDTFATTVRSEGLM